MSNVQVGSNVIDVVKKAFYTLLWGSYSRTCWNILGSQWSIWTASGL